MNKCLNFDFNLYFKLNRLLSDLVSDSSLSREQVITKFKSEIEKNLFNGTVSIEQIQNFIENSTLPTEIKANLATVKEFPQIGVQTTVEQQPEKQAGAESSAAIITQVEKAKTEIDNNTVVTADGDKEIVESGNINQTGAVNQVQLIKSKNMKNVSSIDDLYRNVFFEQIGAYTTFVNNFKQRLFAETFISFDKKLFESGKSMIVDSAEDLNRNIQEFRALLKEELGDFFVHVNDDIILKDGTLTSNDLSVAYKNGTDFAKAHFAYVSLLHFDQLVSMLATGIEVDASRKGDYVTDQNKKYDMKLSHKQKNNMSDDLVNMVDEIDSVTRTMLETVPLLDAYGKPKFNQYLTTTDVLNVLSELKDMDFSNLDTSLGVRLSIEENLPKFNQCLTTTDVLNVLSELKDMDFSNLDTSLGVRLSIEENLPKLLENIIKNRHLYTKLDDRKMDVIRTVYNYFYKPLNDNTTGTNPNTVSLLTIKNKRYQDGIIKHNILEDAITSMIDGVVSQQYITNEQTLGGTIRRITSSMVVDVYLSKTQKTLNAFANQKINHGLDTKKTYSVYTFPSTGKMTVNFNSKPNIKPKHVDFLTKEEWNQFNMVSGTPEGIQNLEMSDAKKTFAMIVKLAAESTGLQLTSDDGAEIRDMTNNSVNPNLFAEELLVLANRMRFFQQVSYDYTVNLSKNPNSELSGFFVSNKLNNMNISESNDGIDRDMSRIINKNTFQPFSKGSNKANLTQQVITSYSATKAFLSGDMSKAGSKNLNKDTLPSTSKINLINDDNTTFGFLKENLVESDMLSSNLFNYGITNGNENFKILKGTAYRADTKNIEGRIKNIKKFNSGEIAYQAFALDFYGSLSERKADGSVIVGLDVSVFADKGPQPIKLVDLARKVKYPGFEEKSLLEFTDNELKNLYFETMRNSYKKAHDKLVGDYKSIFNHFRTTQSEEFKKTLAAAKVKDSTVEQIDEILKVWSKKMNLNNVPGTDIQLEFHFTNLDGVKRVNGYLRNKFAEFEVTSDKPNRKLFEKRSMNEDKKFAFFFEKTNPKIQVYDSDGKIDADFYNMVSTYVNNVADGKGLTVDEIIKDWTDPKTGYMIHYKKESESKNQSPKGWVYDDSVNVEINPMLAYFNRIYRVTTGNYMMTTVGGPYAHKIKIGEKAIRAEYESLQHKDLITYEDYLREAEESARTIAMHKRLVAYMAKMNTTTQDLIQGITTHPRFSVVEDLGKLVHNTTGGETKFDTGDGGGLIPGASAVCMRNSFGTEGKNVETLKLLRHALDSNTGVAQLDKYAVQVITNQRMRQSDIAKNPYIQATKLAYNSVDFSEVIPAEMDKNFLSVIYNNKGHLHPEVSFDNFNESVNQLIMPEFLNNKPVQYIEEGFDVLTETVGMGYYPNTGEYIVVKTFTDITSGKPTQCTEPGYTQIPGTNKYYKQMPLNTLWDIWSNVLGGMYSVIKDTHSPQFDGMGYRYTEDSHEQLSQFMNNVNFKKDKKMAEAINAMGIKTKMPSESGLINQTNYYQPLKEALVWQINNTTGIKNGAKNVNPVSVFSDTNVNKLNYYISDSTHYGVQGDFGHISSEEHQAETTEPTQVVSAAASGGMSQRHVGRIYKSIANFIKNSISDEMKALAQNNDKVYVMMSKHILSILSSKDHIGLAQSYGEKALRDIENLYEENPDLEFLNDAQFKIGFSDPNFYAPLIPMISGFFNSNVIKRNFSGDASILAQCHDSIMVVDQIEDDGTQKTIGANRLLREKTKQLRESFTKDGVLNVDEFRKAQEQLKNSFRKWNAEGTPILTSADQIGAYDIVRAGDYTFELGSIQELYNFKKFGVAGLNGVKYLTEETAKLFENGKGEGWYHGNVFVAKKGDEFKVSKMKGLPRNLIPNTWSFEADGRVYNEEDLASAKAIFALVNYLEKDKKPENLKSYEAYKEYLDPYMSEIGDPDKLLVKLISIQQDEMLALANGVLKIGPGNKESDYVRNGKVNKTAGEIIMSNYNRFKFGLKEGTDINDVTLDFFKTQLANVENFVNDANLEFSLQNKNGNHIYMTHRSNVYNDNGSALLKITKNKNYSIRKIEGLNYLVSSNGDQVCEIPEGCSFEYVNGMPTILYQKLEDVNKASQSEYFIGLGYNPKLVQKRNARLAEYANTYDIQSLKYFTGDPNLYNDTKGNRVEKLASELLSSWHKQLEIIGARIPAQAFQSFMAMKIIGFVEGDNNAAYVPVKKNYLDGSDFDIDKIYLIGLGINKHGKLQSWTKYFNFKNVESSMELPMPSRMLLQNPPKGKLEMSPEDINKASRYASAYLTGNEELTTNNEDFDAFVELVNLISENDAMFDTKLDDMLTRVVTDFFASEVTDKNRMLEATKNMAMGALYKVSNAIENFLASNRGVDMDAPQNGAKKSPKTSDSRQWSNDNFMTVAMMREENNAGKDVIGIAAVGTKIFYNTGFYFNRELDRLEQSIAQYGSWEAVPNQAEIIKEMRGMMNLNPIKIKTKDSKTGEDKIKVIIPTFLADLNFRNKPLLNKAYDAILADVRSKQYEVDGTIMSPEVIDIRTLPDTSLILSALLSAATDNAKELILSKINAGPELAGMYVSMIINGLSFDEITDIMVSPTVDAIVAESKSNVFNNSNGSIDKAVKFFKTGPKMRTFLSAYHVETLWKITNGNKANHAKFLGLITDPDIKEQFLEKNKKGSYVSIAHRLDSYLAGISDFEAFKKLLYESTGAVDGVFNIPLSPFNEDAYGLDEMSFNYPMNRFLSEYDRYLGIKNSPSFDNTILETFEEQYKVANELTVYGRRLGINGGMPTSLEAHINHDAILSDLFMDNVTEKLSGEEIEQYVSRYRDIMGDDTLELRDLTDVSNLRKINLQNNTEKLRHQQHVALMTELYGRTKQRFNIIDMELRLDHINAMWQASKTAQESFVKVSTVYDYTKRLIKDLTNKDYFRNNGKYFKFDEKQLKQIERFIVSDIVRQFFDIRMGDSSLVLEEDLDFYYDEHLQAQTSGKNVKIDLTTPHGRINFTIFMEKFVRDEKSRSTNNAFINDLMVDYQIDPTSDDQVSYVKLNFDMMNQKTDSDKLKLENYMIGIHSLGKENYKGIKKSDLFVIYNILMHNNAFGQSTFTKLFENDVKDDNSLISQYMQYVGDVDVSKNSNQPLYDYSTIDLDRLAITLAPTLRMTELTNDNYKYVKAYKKGKQVILERDPDAGPFDIKYKKEVVLSQVSGVPTKLYLQDNQIRKKIGNVVIDSAIAKNLIDAQNAGDIQILINC